MGRFVFKLPDVGEGTAEAELVGWHVKLGDTVSEDQILADVMTDKATVEITSPVSGVVVHEAPKTSGYGAELSALVQERCFYHLEAPVQRVCGWDTPYPHAFEWEYFPGPERVATAIKRVMEG